MNIYKKKKQHEIFFEHSNHIICFLIQNEDVNGSGKMSFNIVKKIIYEKVIK